MGVQCTEIYAIWRHFKQNKKLTMNKNEVKAKYKVFKNDYDIILFITYYSWFK